MTELSPAPPQPSLGALLIGLRQARGLTLEEVSQRLRFSVRQLQLLETGEFDSLPDMAVVRAMTRAYGRFLEADVPLLIRQLELERPDAQRLAITASAVSVAPQGVATFAPNVSSTRRWVLAALLVLFLAAVVALFWRGSEAPQQDNVSPASETLNKEQPPVMMTPGGAESSANSDSSNQPAHVPAPVSPEPLPKSADPVTSTQSIPAPRPLHPEGKPAAPGLLPHPEGKPAAPGLLPHPEAKPAAPGLPPHPEGKPAAPGLPPHPEAKPAAPGLPPHPEAKPAADPYTGDSSALPPKRIPPTTDAPNP